MLNLENALFIGAFLAGLLLAVFAMLHGVERVQAHRISTTPPAAFNTPVLAAFCIGFGATGYLLWKYSPLSGAVTIAIAIVAAAAAWLAMTALMARWALRGPLMDPHTEAEQLQGTFAVVTRSISPDAPGEIRYVIHDQNLVASARDLSGNFVAEGTEVVIDAIVNGVAEVELWSAVEQRL